MKEKPRPHRPPPRGSPWPLLALFLLLALLMTASLVWEEDRLHGVTCLCISLFAGVYAGSFVRTGEALTRQGHYTRADQPLRFWYTVVFIGAFGLLFGVCGLGLLLGLWPAQRAP